MRSVVSDLELDLAGISVITEAASGPFAVTPLIAALANADRVYAVTRDSRYGQAAEVIAYVESWADMLRVKDRIEFSMHPAVEFAPYANVVTNLGFVRPIDRKFVQRLPDDSAVSLMWEPWEFRPSDLDLAACRDKGVPVMGTKETHPRLNIFAYLGMLAQKLLLEAEIEVYGANVVLVGSDPFGRFAESALLAAGAHVNRIQLPDPAESLDGVVGAELSAADALVLYEHRDRRCLVGGTYGIDPARLCENGVPIIHLCGVVDGKAITDAGVRKYPDNTIEHGTMTVTTGYLGPRPVIDLHAAGLKVGEIMVRALRNNLGPNKACEMAVASGFGSAIPETTS